MLRQATIIRAGQEDLFMMICYLPHDPLCGFSGLDVTYHTPGYRYSPGGILIIGGITVLKHHNQNGFYVPKRRRRRGRERQCF